jgi:RND superfamily putative drug exporter
LTETQLKAALAALESMTTGRQDPRYEAALLAVQEASALVTGLSPATGKPLSPKYPGLTRALSEIATSAGRAATSAGALAASTAKLQSGLTQLHDGERTLAGGLAQLQSGDSHESAALAQLQQQAAQSEPGIDRLASGEQQLSGGIAKLATAAGQLSSSLRSAPTRTAPVRGALAQSRSALAGARRLLSESAALQRLTRQSPGLFQSGDSLLAALDGAPSPVRREAASFVSIARGGQGARLFVVPRTGPTSAATARLYDRLKRITAAFARRTGTAAAVGGDAALVIDYARQVSGILPVLIITLAVVTWLALVVVARALILPLIAVALNLLTVSAAFGALVLLYQGSAPLGGPGYLDAVAVVGIFGIVFGLSIDYEVFLVSRMREEYARTGSTDAAIAGGLLQTAGVVTGAAAIMAGVFLAFASSSFVDIAEFGTGLTIAVVLDATLVRIVLLPALTRLCGDRAWWLPAWLERIIAPAHGAPGPNGGAPSPGNGAGPHSSAIATAYSASSPTR